jgi:GTP cyclohydrolase I
VKNLESCAENFSNIIENIGEDLSRDGLQKTPMRAAKAMQYLTHGYSQTLDEVVNNAIFESANDQMVIIKDIEVYSMCEHHMLPFIGRCHVAYLPSGKVIGLSKIARIVDMYARRLQIQENLTTQIAHAVEETTSPRGVGVIVEAKHLCMMMRGVEKQNSSMKTSMMLGAFKVDHRTRTEFLRLVSD